MSDLSTQVKNAAFASNKFDYADSVLHGQMNGDYKEIQEIYQEAAKSGDARGYLRLAEMQHRRIAPDTSKANNIKYLSLALENAAGDDAVRLAALEKLTLISDRMNSRMALLATGAPTSDRAEDIKDFKYAQEKAAQDISLLPTVTEGLSTGKIKYIQHLSETLVTVGTDLEKRAPLLEELKSIADRIQARNILRETGEPASNAPADIAAYAYAVKKEAQDALSEPVIQNALNQDKLLHFDQNEVYGINNN